MRVHEPVDLWDINFCTHGFRGSSYYWHPQILRPRDLFYRTDCTHSSKIIPNACHTVEYITRQSLVESGLITNVLTSMKYQSNVLFLNWKNHNRPKVMCPKSSQQISKLGYEVETWSYALEWKMSVPLRAFYRRAKSLYTSRPVRYLLHCRVRHNWMCFYSLVKIHNYIWKNKTFFSPSF